MCWSFGNKVLDRCTIIVSPSSGISYPLLVWEGCSFIATHIRAALKSQMEPFAPTFVLFTETDTQLTSSHRSKGCFRPGVRAALSCCAKPGFAVYLWAASSLLVTAQNPS